MALELFQVLANTCEIIWFILWISLMKISLDDGMTTSEVVALFGNFKKISKNSSSLLHKIYCNKLFKTPVCNNSNGDSSWF